MSIAWEMAGALAGLVLVSIGAALACGPRGETPREAGRRRFFFHDLLTVCLLFSRG